MEATLKITGNEHINTNHRKESKLLDEIIAVVGYKDEKHSPGCMGAVQDLWDDKDLMIRDVVNLRTYGTENRNYVCIWVAGKGIYTSGSGWAGGWGYHRPSAAAHEAIKNAGIILSQPIDSRGHSAMVEAVQAIAKAIIPDAVFIHIVESHG